VGKPLLVMLPGMLCDERLFAPQVDYFSTSHEVFVGKLVGASTIDELAENLLEQIEAPRFNLLGLSMGGIVAMAMSKIAPERIDRLALLDTNHKQEPEAKRINRDRQINDVRAGKLREVVIEEMKPNYVAKIHRGNQALLDLLVSMAMDWGDEVFINQSTALKNRDSYDDVLGRYEKPSLVLCGEEDNLCPVQRHKEIAALMSDAELEIISNAGHISTLENSIAVNGAIEKWLARPVHTGSPMAKNEG